MPDVAAEGPLLAPGHPIRGLIVDWGGVLTGPLTPTIERWASTDGIDLQVYWQVVEDWMGGRYALEARMNPIHALERGEMQIPDFENRLAHEMSLRTGIDFPGEGFVQRMFDHFEHAHDMNALVHRAHKAGIRTALLSNSWGNEYPRDGWDDMFDAVVISGEVGMRKPDADIYEHALGVIGLSANECVFVDDLAPNVTAAVDLGMIGILHRSYDATAMEIDAIFDLPLS